jgi:hypothetical protein
MNKILEDLVAALDEVGDLIIRSWSDDRTLKEHWGWNFPALTRHDLAGIAILMAKRIKEVNAEDLDDDMILSIKNAARQVRLLKADTIQHFYNGHGFQAVPAYFGVMMWLESILSQLFGWQSIADNKMMPSKLAARIRSVNARFEQIVPDLDDLERKVKIIDGATEAADSLPTDLEELKRARDQVEVISVAVASTQGKVEQRHKEVEEIIGVIKNGASEAERLAEQCGEAYRVTTTVGLAAAFDQRAGELGRSMWIWVSFLVIALGLGAYIGSQRIGILTAALKDVNPNWAIISINLVLSAISIGAPIWFSWLATKQIGQRFRLAEDYSFKASVAKAYEGYRREAARIDPIFESRLFGSALARLEEAPLRLVEEASHGSPWHELVNSGAFNDAINKFPSLKEVYSSILFKRSENRGPENRGQS